MGKITGKRRAFINFTQDLLVNRIPLMFPRERIVVEVLEDIEPEEDVINACREMAGILGLGKEDLPRYYMDSVYWADSFMGL
jgi:c-di-GMP-related signal transduction protein